MADPPFLPLAAVAIDEVRPERQGFTLTGQGGDQAEYRLDLRFELPLDPRTRTILGELLTHSAVTIARRTAASPFAGLRGRRERVRRP